MHAGSLESSRYEREGAGGFVSQSKKFGFYSMCSRSHWKAFNGDEAS